MDAPGALDDFRSTKAFLTSYSRRSSETFDKFRGNAERWLLWSRLIRGKPVVQLRRRDLEDYIDFVYSPPASWIAETTSRQPAQKLIAHGKMSQNLVGDLLQMRLISYTKFVTH